jgi:NAD(P)H-hydrate epimerase
VLPVVTPQEMAAIDAAAPEPVELLIGRAGQAVARRARRLLGGTYGRRVTVIAGKGNNGADGRAAANLLAAKGVRVQVVDIADAPQEVGGADLVIDAAFGTGFRGEIDMPAVGATPVLAVDIPSGVDGLTGRIGGCALRARVTVTFAALKPGLLLEPGRTMAGSVEVADIGLAVDDPGAWLVQRSDVSAWVPGRPRDAHKWQAAVLVVAGSAGMSGAAALAAAAAQRAGAGMVRLATPGGTVSLASPVEVVAVDVPASGWARAALEQAQRCHAIVVGPGLGTSSSTRADVRELVEKATVPVVVDGDGLTALGGDAGTVLARRSAPSVLTPHEGEFARLAGHAPGADRFDAVRALSSSLGATILLKGPTTLVAGPAEPVLVVTAGDERLATAGTGDVLAGVVAALLARGLPPTRAAAAAAWLHGRAASHAEPVGLVASDLLRGLVDAQAEL